MTKHCPRCDQELPVSSFNRHKSALYYTCRVCAAKWQREYRAANREKYSTYEKTRYQRPDIKAKKKALATRRWRNRSVAINATYKAMRHGILVKQPCARCGGPAEAHHPDYSQPLNVVWLCRQHHAEEHRVL